MLAGHLCDDVRHAVLRLLLLYKFTISSDYLVLVLTFVVYVALHPVIVIGLINIVINTEVIFIKADRFELITSFEGFGEQVEHVVV